VKNDDDKERTRRTSRTAAGGAPGRETARRPRTSGAARAEPGAAPRAKKAAVAPREDHVAVAAYYRAEKRGFAPGLELEDWLAAESELALRAPAAPRRAPARKPPAA
jgi:hypothetical protein